MAPATKADPADNSGDDGAVIDGDASAGVTGLMGRATGDRYGTKPHFANELLGQALNNPPLFQPSSSISDPEPRSHSAAVRFPEEKPIFPIISSFPIA